MAVIMYLDCFGKPFSWDCEVDSDAEQLPEVLALVLLEGRQEDCEAGARPLDWPLTLSLEYTALSQRS